MQNTKSMSAINCGWGIVSRSYLSTRPISPVRFSFNSRLRTTSQESVPRVKFPRRRLQLSSFGSCGGKALYRERPIEWKRNWSSVRPLTTAREAGEKPSVEKELESVAGGDLNRIGKPEICTADELHYVAVPKTDWRLALWRYRPSKLVRRGFTSVQFLKNILRLIYTFMFLYVYVYVHRRIPVCVRFSAYLSSTSNTHFIAGVF